MNKADRTSILFASFAALPVLAALWIVSTQDYTKYYDNHLMDVRLYATTSANFLNGQWPYRDFPLEYPPFALAAFTLPRLLAFGAGISEPTYIRLFLLENLALAAIAAWMIARLLPVEHRSRALRTMALLLVVSSTIWPWRYDMFPAVLTLAGLYCLCRNRLALSGIWFGLGIAAKLYPVVAFLACVTYLAARKDWKPLAKLTAAATAAGAAVTLPFLLAAPHQWSTFLEYHRARGIQIESALGGFVELGGVLGLTTIKPIFNYGAFHLISDWADVALRLQLPLFTLTTGACLYLLYQRLKRVTPSTGGGELQFEPAPIAQAILILLLAFIATNKVFSAQYVVWLCPFIPLIQPKLIFRFILLFALTSIIFPYLYGFLVMGLPAAVVVLNARNLLAVALLGGLIRTLRPSRETSPTQVANQLSR